MIKLLEEAISSLEHAQVFISSKEKMNKNGTVLHQETIDSIRAKLKHLNNIESVRQQFSEQIKDIGIESLNSKERCIEDNVDNLEEAITKFKKN